MESIFQKICLVNIPRNPSRKHVAIIFALLTTFSLVLIFNGCKPRIDDRTNGSDEEVDIQRIAENLNALDTNLFRNIRAEYRSKNRTEKRLMITTFSRNQFGFVWLKLDKNHHIQLTEFEFCKDSSVLTRAKVKNIGVQVDKLGYWVVSMDSFANVYVSVHGGKYNYAMIRDMSNAWQDFNYKNEFDNFYRMSYD